MPHYINNVRRHVSTGATFANFAHQAPLIFSQVAVARIRLGSLAFRQKGLATPSHSNALFLTCSRGYDSMLCPTIRSLAMFNDPRCQPLSSLYLEVE